MAMIYSGSQGSQGNQISQKWLYLHVLHVVAPMVHWLPRMTKMSNYTWHQYSLSHGAHWGPYTPLGLGWGLTLNLTHNPSGPFWLHSQVSHNSQSPAPWPLPTLIPSLNETPTPSPPSVLCRADQCGPSTLDPLSIWHSHCSCLTPSPFT